MTMQIAAPRQPAHGPYHRIVGAVGKDTVSRVWRKVKVDREAWNARSLAGEPIVRLILDDTAVRARITEEIAGQTWAWGRLFHSPG